MSNNTSSTQAIGNTLSDTENDDFANTVKALTEIMGPYFADVFVQAKQLFAGYAVLDRLTHQFSSNRGDFAAIPDRIAPHILIGLKNEFDSANLRNRIISRFGVPKEIAEDEEVGSALCRYIIYAHELAHVLQCDLQFERDFGDLGEYHPLPDVTQITREGYEPYVTSGPEENADYIASYIFSHTELGQMLGMEPPELLFTDWRQWAKERPVDISVLPSAINDQYHIQ